MPKIACIVPTIREAYFKEFLKKWDNLFRQHEVSVVPVYDGEIPKLGGIESTAEELMGEYADLIYNYNSGVRNLGVAYVYKEMPEIEYFLTLDDDVFPNDNDPIQEHLDALNKKVPVSWLSTASEYMRGFPYAVREESEVVLSHGVWEGVKDWDAATQLTHGNREVDFYRGPIPKGIYYPMCSMNLMWKRKATPYMYMAPMGPRAGLDRFEDIWCGIESKRQFDKKGWAVISGMATCYHSRASNVFINLVKEAKGVGLNENYWSGTEEDTYFTEYKTQRKRWIEYLEK